MLVFSGQLIPDPILTWTISISEVQAPITAKKELLDVKRDEASLNQGCCLHVEGNWKGNTCIVEVVKEEIKSDVEQCWAL